MIKNKKKGHKVENKRGVLYTTDKNAKSSAWWKSVFGFSQN